MAESKDESGDLYDLAPAPADAEPRKAIPITNAPREVKLNYRGRTDERAVTAEPDKIKNFYMPIWLLSAGILIDTVAAFFEERTIAEALISVGVKLVLGTVIMLAGILIAAKARHIDLGNFWTAVFKLSAVAVAPSAAVALVSPVLRFIPFGFLLIWAIEFVAYFALLGVFFDLDESDTWYCVWTIFLVNLGIYFAIYFSGWR